MIGEIDLTRIQDDQTRELIVRFVIQATLGYWPTAKALKQKKACV